MAIKDDILKAVQDFHNRTDAYPTFKVLQDDPLFTINPIFVSYYFGTWDNMIQQAKITGGRLPGGGNPLYGRKVTINSLWRIYQRDGRLTVRNINDAPDLPHYTTVIQMFGPLFSINHKFREHDVSEITDGV